MQYIFMYLVLILFNPLLLHASTSSIYLSPGMKYTFPLKSHDQVWIESPLILRAQESPNHIQIRAAKEGASQVQIGTNLYSVTVLPEQTYKSYKIISDLVAPMMGLKVEVLNQEVEVTGSLLRMDDWVAIAEIAKKENLNYRFRAQPERDLHPIIKNFFADLFSKSSQLQAEITFIPDLRVLISNEEKDHLTDLQNIISPYGLEIDTSLSKISIAPMVRVKITLAEVRTDELKRYGIQWPGALTATAGQNSFVIDDAEFALNALSTEGEGRVLASPTLMARSGTEAEFLAGGEIPIRLTGYGNRGVVWKRYGVSLKVKPRADTGGRMSIAVTTEVSSLDHSTAVDGIPGMLTNRFDTHFDLEKSQTIVLSGLLKHSDGTTSEGLIGLSKIPFIGRLFSSKEYRRQGTELIALVTPEVVQPQN